MQIAQDRKESRKLVKNTANKGIEKNSDTGGGSGKGKGRGKGIIAGTSVSSNDGTEVSNEEEEESDEEEGEHNELELVMCPFTDCGKMCRGRIGLRRHITCKHRGGTQGEDGFRCG